MRTAQHFPGTDGLDKTARHTEAKGIARPRGISTGSTGHSQAVFFGRTGTKKRRGIKPSLFILSAVRHLFFSNFKYQAIFSHGVIRVRSEEHTSELQSLR